MKISTFILSFMCAALIILVMSCGDDEETVQRFESQLIGDMQMEILNDTETNLTWVNDIRGCFAAIVIPTNECEDLVFAGQDDWRLPSPDEMIELITEITERDMALNYINTECALMSTSDTTVWVFTENSSMPGLTTVNKPGNAGVRCVRN